MPWYYAGPEAKPIGPISVEELHASYVRGVVKPETYVIEQTGAPIEALAWKRYQDVFPANASHAMPPLPPVPAPPVFAPPVAAPPPAPVAAQPHPLFPSAAVPVAPQPSVFPPSSRPDPYYNVKPTNSWCLWGFGLGLAAFFFSFICGSGLLPALVSYPLCLVGIAQVQKRREQSGQGLATAGLVLSTVALIISLVIVLYLAVPFLKAHGLTVTEQTTNDSE